MSAPVDPPDPPSAVPRPGAIYTTTPEGGIVCALCARRDGTHAADCAVVIVRAQLRELTAQLGMFAAIMRETLDTVDHLLRGEDVG